MLAKSFFGKASLIRTVSSFKCLVQTRFTSDSAYFRIHQDNHKDYNGRSKLDAATLDRFDKVDLEKDDMLEQSIVDFNTYANMELVRKCLKEINSPTYISMRDSIRFQKRKELGLLDTYIDRLLAKDLTALEKYHTLKISIPKVSKVTECNTMKEVWEHTVGDRATSAVPF